VLRAVKAARPGACPGCGAPAADGEANPWRPFCSERCKLADLGQWFAGRYSILLEDDAGKPEPPPDPTSRQ
jgi:endogenous inhibitor of DNA gyrase (YacG/DUF329 family)